MTGPRMPFGPVFFGEPAVQDDEFSNLRNSLKRSTALRVTEQAAPRVVEAFPHAKLRLPATSRRHDILAVVRPVIPILVALVSSAGLAYFLLTGDRRHHSSVTRRPRTQSPSSVPSQGKEQRQADKSSRRKLRQMIEARPPKASPLPSRSKSQFPLISDLVSLCRTTPLF